jgi:hypothetical protein
MFRNLTLGLVVALGLAACGSARVISRTQAGGVIELQGDKGKAMEQANQEMSAHCGPGNFTITQEGEEVIGTDTVATEDTAEDTKTSRSGRRQSTDTSTVATTSTRNATAWRVHYSCNGQGGGGAPPPPPAGDPGPAPDGGGAPPPPPAGGGY